MADYDDGTNVRVFFDTVGGETKLAYKILITPTDSEGVWIPKSQVKHIDTDAGEVLIPEWLARNNGLEYD